jgi:hypothetical protein
MAVTESVISSKRLGLFGAGGDLCSNPDCSRISQVKCATCELRYCYGHSKHPEHS